MELIELTAIYADWALESIPRQYPNHVSLSLRGAKDLAEPRHNTPIFYGCYDWHSSVHSHWMLVRLARLYPEAPYVDRALALLSSNFAPTNFVGEFKYLSAGHRQTFERPYGLAWLLQLGAELRQWPAEYAQAWAVGIEPLETWVTPVQVSDPADPKLAHLDGLNLSRAWMLEGVASKLSSDDPRVSSVQGASMHHREVALATLTDQHYEGTHWLGSFVTYLVTARGID